jgi:hypothetical protein
MRAISHDFRILLHTFGNTHLQWICCLDGPYGIVESRLHWHGQFASPAFGVLGDPNVAYAGLYRALQPYGLTLDAFNIDFSNFPRAEIRCQIPAYDVGLRLGLERLEIGFLNLQKVRTPVELVAHVRKTLSDANQALVVAADDINVDVWAAADPSLVDQYLGTLVSVPEALRPARVSARIVQRRADSTRNIRLARAEVFTEGLFYHLDFHYDQSADAGVVWKRFGEDVREVLASLGVEAD